MSVTKNMADKISLGFIKEEPNPPKLSAFQATSPYEALIEDLETCSKGAPCQDCNQPKKWNCDWVLMERAKAALIELLTIHRLDQSEIVRMRRLIEMKEEEKWQDLKDGNRSPYRKEQT